MTFATNEFASDTVATTGPAGGIGNRPGRPRRNILKPALLFHGDDRVLPIRYM